MNGRTEMEFLSSRYRYARRSRYRCDFCLPPELINRIRSPTAISPAGMLHWRLYTVGNSARTRCAQRSGCTEKRKAMSRLDFDPGDLLSSEYTFPLYDTCLLALLLAPDCPFPWKSSALLPPVFAMSTATQRHTL